ncbi:hypothetical protein B4O97_15605 [Marispirochaeta aestuarii]|uniref:SMP-30/Gluconolactonase/LRE-like region domain-containing protein n=1 Tax=Marispirochaeta aestuarii TaxID=1963862 RepID=A0A1Y1RVM2_9SPIO|nr:SMP-30/gluconolactonase/LRE family protein [Marispirochaeta aestuarii]ORC32721.1 hypothetical protein B4O97_15605 [Marispirochaeta aestuarii]
MKEASKIPVEVEAFNNRFRQIVKNQIFLETLATGFRFLEGPVWIEDQNRLIFSDIPGNALYSWDENKGISLLRPNSYLANGNAYDKDGILITCEHGTSRVSATDLRSGTYTVLADSYNGRCLNSPNDVVLKSDKNIYFTDPMPGRFPRVGIPRPPELSFQGVYMYDRRNAFLYLLEDGLQLPNGLCFSPDEKILYVNDSAQGIIFAFDVGTKGMLENKRIFSSPQGSGDGVLDGMKCTSRGTIFCTGPGGIFIIDEDGDCLGRINIPEVAANFTWGEDERTLYITATSTVYRMKIR